MLQLISLVFFAAIVYTFLVIVPTMVEKFSNEEFREAYFAHLSSPHINSYGK